MALVYFNYLFNRLDGFYHGTNLPLKPPILQDNMVGIANSTKGVFMDFLAPILLKISGDLTREALIELHQLIIGNVASFASNIGGVWHGHLALTITKEDFLEQTH